MCDTDTKNKIQRLTEDVTIVKNQVEGLKNEHTEINRMVITLEFIEKDIAEIKTNVNSNFITRDQFEPVKKIVYGLVSLVLTGVCVALIALVINK